MTHAVIVIALVIGMLAVTEVFRVRKQWRQIHDGVMQLAQKYRRASDRLEARAMIARAEMLPDAQSISISAIYCAAVARDLLQLLEDDE